MWSLVIKVTASDIWLAPGSANISVGTVTTEFSTLNATGVWLYLAAQAPDSPISQRFFP